MYVTRNLSFEEHHAGNYDVVWGRNTTFSSRCHRDIKYVVKQEQQQPTTRGKTVAVLGLKPKLGTSSGPEGRMSSPSQVEFVTPLMHDDNLDTNSGGPH
jgi:hypothetical protein